MSEQQDEEITILRKSMVDKDEESEKRISLLEDKLQEREELKQRIKRNVYVM